MDKNPHPLLRLIFMILLGGAIFLPSFAYADNPPYAQTFPATRVTEKSVQLNGQVNTRATQDTYQWFEWGIAGRYDIAYETYRYQTWSMADAYSPTSAYLYSLAPNTQYWFRQVAENSRGKDKGSMLFFTTKEAPQTTGWPVVAQTGIPKSITGSSATLAGTVSPHGNSAIKWWFEYGTGITALHSKTPVQTGGGGDAKPVEAQITGLSPNTVYYFRAAAEAPSMTSYGATGQFQTGSAGTVLGASVGTAGTGTPAPTGGYVIPNNSTDADIAALENLVAKLQAEVARLTAELQRKIARGGTR